VAGAYALRRTDRPTVTVVAMGAVIPEALAAADRAHRAGLPDGRPLCDESGLLFRALPTRRGLDDADTGVLDSVFPADRATPMVTVLDGHPHTLAFLTGVHRVRGAPRRHPVRAERRPARGLPAPRPGRDTIVGAALDLVD
jgi:pyruvate dehydrogenase E1 component